MHRFFLDKDTIIKPGHLPSNLTGIRSTKPLRSLKSTLKEAERQSIIDSLIVTNGNKTEAAKILDISRTSLYEKMAKYQINGRF